jgi:hypothetical protein
MRNALGLQASGWPALSAKLEDLRREHVKIRANCARQSEAAIEMRRATADMRAWTRRQRVVPR